MDISTAPTSAYQVRYGLTRFTGLTLAVSTALLVAGGFALVRHAFFGVAGLLLIFAGGLGLVLVCLPLVRRMVALKVSQDGIFLGGDPLRYRSSSSFVAWTSIDEVVFWRRQELIIALGRRGVRLPNIYIGLTGDENALETAGKIRSFSALGSPLDNVRGLVRPTGSYRLNLGRLIESAHEFAPGVMVRDLTTSSDASPNASGHP